ncbi:MAG: hypothetical protein IJV44_03015 [Prevotella sp.]|nr:hypothetical protein [Prevotella sp.]
MKQNQLIVKALVVAALFLGGVTSANAQFGGLLNKAKARAKYKVESKVENAVDNAIDKAVDKAGDAAQKKVNNVVENSSVGEKVGLSSVSGSKYDKEDQKVEAHSDMDYSIARANDWNADSNIDDIIADLAYHLKNSHKLESYLHVKRHYPSFLDVFEARLKPISGLAHASGMSSFNDGVTDPKLKDKIEKWRAEMQSWIPSPASYYPSAETMGSLPYMNAEDVIKGWQDAVKDKPFFALEGRGKFEAVTDLYNELEEAIMAGKIKGTEGRFQAAFEDFKALYNQWAPESAKQYFASEITYNAIKELAMKRKEETKQMISQANAERATADAKYRKDELLRMYKDAAAAGRYKTIPASKDTQLDQYMKNYVEKNYPEWGKVIKVSCPKDYNVYRDKLGNITYRSQSCYIVCEDQGYKAIHGISLHETYQGSKYMNPIPRNDRWNSGPLDLMK